MSNAEKYNVCNPEPDAYCMFEKQVGELREQIQNIQNIVLEYMDIPMCEVGKTVLDLIDKELLKSPSLSSGMGKKE